MIRFADDRVRIVTALIQPLLFLFVLAPGLQSLSAASTDGVDLTTFMFPGVLCMAMWFSGMISAASLVMDRELGFLREMMVAPVRRSSIVLGKCLGGTTTAMIQGVILLALAGLVHVPYDPVLLLGIFGLQLLIAFTVTALGVMVATTVKQAQTFNSVMQVLVFPMVFLSGAMYPVSGLPSWLGVLNRLNPLTYAVDPMRRLVFDHLDISEAARDRLAPGVTWWGWPVPTLLEAGDRAGPGPGDAGGRHRPVHADGVTRQVRRTAVVRAGRTVPPGSCSTGPVAISTSPRMGTRAGPSERFSATARSRRSMTRVPRASSASTRSSSGSPRGSRPAEVEEPPVPVAHLPVGGRACSSQSRRAGVEHLDGQRVVDVVGRPAERLELGVATGADPSARSGSVVSQKKGKALSAAHSSPWNTQRRARARAARARRRPAAGSMPGEVREALAAAAGCRSGRGSARR